MRTLTLLLSVAALVAACRPAAAPEPTSTSPAAIPPTDPYAATVTPASVEAPVAEIADLASLWWFTGCPCKAEFKTDGSYTILGRANEPPEAVGNFPLDAGKVSWVTSDPLCKELPQQPTKPM